MNGDNAINRYTECTKFLGKVCEIVHVREDAIARLQDFSSIVEELLASFERLDLVVESSATSSDDLMQCQDDLMKLKEMMQKCTRYILRHTHCSLFRMD